jgi:hypothetical protein
MKRRKGAKLVPGGTYHQYKDDTAYNAWEQAHEEKEPNYFHLHNDCPFSLEKKKLTPEVLYGNAENKTRTGAFRMWN